MRKMTIKLYKIGVFRANNSTGIDFAKIISDFFSAIPSDVGISADNLSDKLSARAFIGDILTVVGGESGEIFSFFALLFMWIIISHLSSPFSHRLDANMGISFIFSLSVLSRLLSVCIELVSSLSSLSVFFTAAIPTLTVIEMSSGAIATGGVRAAQMTLITSLVNGLSVGVLLPLAIAMLALSATASVGGFSSHVITAARTAYTRALTLATAVLSMLFSLQSVLASASDSASLRMARLSAQTLIPEVGGIVSSSLAALSSGMSYVRGIVGAAAVYTVLFITLTPLLRLLLYRLALSLAAALSEALSAGASKVISAISKALDSIIAVYALSAVLCLFEMILFLVSYAS